MSNTQTLCDCGCDVRGLTKYQLSGYRKNYDKTTFETYNQQTKSNEMVTVDKHLNNNEHVIAFDLGYVDLDLAIRTANKHIQEKEITETIVEWYEIWDCTNDHKVKSICMHPNLEYVTEISDRGTEFNTYYCSKCDYLQVS